MTTPPIMMRYGIVYFNVQRSRALRPRPRLLWRMWWLALHDLRQRRGPLFEIRKLRSPLRSGRVAPLSHKRKLWGFHDLHDLFLSIDRTCRWFSIRIREKQDEMVHIDSCTPYPYCTWRVLLQMYSSPDLRTVEGFRSLQAWSEPAARGKRREGFLANHVIEQGSEQKLQLSTSTHWRIQS